MKTIRRAIHIDFHTMPGIYDFGDNWDAKIFADILKEAKVEYINAFAKCNIGFAYYPTKIGVPYPQMKIDMFGALLKECHRNDIGVSAYVNVGLDHEQARLHREWCVVNNEGQIIYGDKTANFFRNMCYNTGYRDYILGIIREIFENYPEVDGLFCDCMGQKTCYGNECLEGLEQNGFDPLNDEHVYNHSKETLLNISREIKMITGEERYLYLNGMPEWTVKDLDTHYEIECLPSAWSYDYFGSQVAYSRNIHKTVLYQTGRFQKSWGDFGSFKGKASIENDIWDALSNGVGVAIGDHMHPAENLESLIYNTVRDIYSDIEKYEFYTDGTHYLADIGVITDSTGFLDDTYKGLARMLSELKYCFDIVNETMDLSKYTLLILPDETRVTTVLKQKLEKHLRDGKSILSTGEGGLDTEKTGFALEQWRFQYDGIDTSNSSYFSKIKELEKDKTSMCQAIYCHGILMKAPDDAEVIASYIKPYFNRHWDGFHGYFYTPPEKETGHVTAAKINNVCHICFKIFKAYYDNAMFSHKELVATCIEKLLPEPLLKCKNIPSTARVTLTSKENTVLLHIKTTFPEVRGRMNIIEEHAILPAGAVVSVKGKYSRAYIVLKDTLLDTQIKGNYTDVTLPLINGYIMVVLT